jgi:phosphatidylserine synthase
LTQEVAVGVHGTLVAVFQGQGLWPMFAFGFAGIFILTQMHGLGWSRPVRWLVAGFYLAAALLIYSSRGWVKLNEIIRIPMIEYLLVFVLAGLIALGVWIADRLRKVPAVVQLISEKSNG